MTENKARCGQPDVNPDWWTDVESYPPDQQKVVVATAIGFCQDCPLMQACLAEAERVKATEVVQAGYWWTQAHMPRSIFGGGKDPQALMRKLTQNQQAEIYALYHDALRTKQQIADEYDVTWQQIHKIVTLNRFRHNPEAVA